MTSSQRGAAVPLVDFAALYRDHASDVHRFALYLSGDPSLAEDLVSEAFVRVWTARDRVDLTTVRGYLFAITRNLFLQESRRIRRRTTLDEGMFAAQQDQHGRMSAQESLQTVLAALATLPEIDRSALLMRADENLPYEDIGAALGISIAAARVKVHRARLKLAEALRSANGKESTS
jgi:RNA polymerase sigma-70 factor (ECF subfamily)